MPKSCRVLLFAIIAVFLSSCSRMGYGILLWTTEDPPIMSGTVLPVYIRSNIDQVWVVGVPDSSRKIEVPLSQLEFIGNKRKTEARALEFAQFAPTYAENIQDGLPVRDNPDNSSRRVYRLRLGEIVKVLDKADGIPPVSATGEPLPGDWFLVLTSEGVTGYCFSYRLRIFDHYEGPLLAAPAVVRETAPDPDLEMVLSRTWSPESYQQMINSRRINITELEKRYRFDPGQDTGIAKIYLPDMEMEFIYEGIIPDGERAWRFEGTNLQMNLRTNTTLAVQFLEHTGLRRTLLFVALAADVSDIILQENVRRERQFLSIYEEGQIWTSNNYGTITLSESGKFKWTGFDLLIGHLIPEAASGEGIVLMNVFLSSTLAERYSGAFTLRWTDVTPNVDIYFMYNLDSLGLRLEAVPDYSLEDITITRRAASPVVLYFYKDFYY